MISERFLFRSSVATTICTADFDFTKSSDLNSDPSITRFSSSNGGSTIAKPICSICYEDLNPIIEALQSISICGHVFHELCLQQCIEYCSNVKKKRCPVCKQAFSEANVSRLYFQSVGNLYQKLINCEDNPGELHREMEKLEGKVLGLRSAIERHQKDVQELNEEELDRSTLECVRLQERNMVLAKELATLKLIQVQELHSKEISEWMVSHEEFELSDSDCAVHIALMAEVVGYDATGEYLLGLPDTGKTTETYKALVLIYYWARRLKHMDTILERCEGMDADTLPKAVDKAIQKIKLRNGALNLFTYNLWICSYVSTNNIDTVRTILDEMTHDSGSNKCKVRYANLANICITLGNFMNAESSNTHETISLGWVTYDLPIILYTGLGDKHMVDKIWNLSMSAQEITDRNYGCILSSYLMLGYLREAGEVIDQWKQASAAELVISDCDRLSKAFSDVGLMETAETFHSLLTEKGANRKSQEPSEASLLNITDQVCALFTPSEVGCTKGDDAGLSNEYMIMAEIPNASEAMV
ncbi:unnamed protein product [Camellia sinensis]